MSSRRQIRGILATALVMLVSACSAPGSGVGAGDADVPRARAAAPSSPAAQPCPEGVEACAMLAGGRVIIYPSARGGAKAPLLLWDPGGPGLATPHGEDAKLYLPKWTRQFRVAYLAESWEYDPPSSACLATLEERRLAAVAVDCQGRNGGQFARTMKALDQSQWGPVRGIFAQSFGAVRAMSALDETAVAGRPFVVLESPAPAEVTRSELALARAELAVQNLLRSPGSCKDEQCLASRRRVLDRMLTGSDPQLPQEAAAYGLLAAASDPESNAIFLERLWQDDPANRREVLSALRVAAAGFAMRSPRGKPSSAYVSYLEGMCNAYPASGGDALPLSAQPAEQAFTRALTALWAPCSRWHSKDAIRGKTRADHRALLVVNGADPVVPSHLQKRWTKSLGSRVPTVYYRRAGHGNAPPAAERQIRDFVARMLRRGK